MLRYEAQTRLSISLLSDSESASNARSHLRLCAFCVQLGARSAQGRLPAAWGTRLLSRHLYGADHLEAARSHLLAERGLVCAATASPASPGHKRSATSLQAAPSIPGSRRSMEGSRQSTPHPPLSGMGTALARQNERAPAYPLESGFAQSGEAQHRHRVQRYGWPLLRLVPAGRRHPRLPGTPQTVGIDLGLQDIVTLSTGEKTGNEHFFTQGEKRLARLQRRHAKKRKGSKNREKARRKVAKPPCPHS